MAANVNKKNKGMGIHARRALAYIVLVIISFFCLFWFYVMIINATRSNGELQDLLQFQVHICLITGTHSYMTHFRS